MINDKWDNKNNKRFRIGYKPVYFVDWNFLLAACPGLSVRFAVLHLAHLAPVQTHKDL